MYIFENGEESGDYHLHYKWDVELSGGSWDESGFIYTTDRFVYLLDDNAGVAATRCNGMCTKNFEADYHDASYEIYQDYEHVSNDKVCWGHTDVGRYICKSLEASGYEDRSDE